MDGGDLAILVAIGAGLRRLLRAAAGHRSSPRRWSSSASAWRSAAAALGWIERAVLGRARSRRSPPGTSTLVLFTDAVRLDLPALRQEIDLPQPPPRASGLPLTILAGHAVSPCLFFDELGLWPAAVLATVLAPTDAALGQAVVTDPSLPSRIRQGLNVESGLNDGICVPFLAIFLTLAESDEGLARGEAAPRHRRGDRRRPARRASWPACVGALVLRTALRRGWIERVVARHRVGRRPAAAYRARRRVPRQRVHRRLRRRPRLRAGRRSGGACPPSSPTASGELLGALTFLVFGAVALGPVLGDLTWQPWRPTPCLSLTVVRMLPVAVSHGRHRASAGHGDLRRLVRAPRPGLDRRSPWTSSAESGLGGDLAHRAVVVGRDGRPSSVLLHGLIGGARGPALRAVVRGAPQLGATSWRREPATEVRPAGPTARRLTARRLRPRCRPARTRVGLVVGLRGLLGQPVDHQLVGPDEQGQQEEAEPREVEPPEQEEADHGAADAQAVDVGPDPLDGGGVL